MAGGCGRVPGPVDFAAVHGFSGTGCVVTLHLRVVESAAGFVADLPGVSGVDGGVLRVFGREEEGGLGAHLGDGCGGAEVPDDGCDVVRAGVEVVGEVEGFVAPVVDVAEGWTGADALAVDVEFEAGVGADVNDEVRGDCGEREGFAEVDDVVVAGWAVRRGDPLGGPLLGCGGWEEGGGG